MAHGQNWHWAAGSTSNSFSRADAITTDAADHSFVTGQFADSTWFGSHLLTEGGAWNGNMFLAKYSSSGACLWAKSDSTLLDGMRIGMDAACNLYIAAYRPGLYTLSKWDSSGTRLWNVLLPFNITINDLVTDQSGNCWLSGRQLTGQSIFGSDTIRDTAGVVLRYDMNGNALGATPLGRHGKIEPSFLELDANGNYIIAASLTGTDTLDGQALTFDGATVLVFKITPAGNLQWHLSGEAPAPGNAFSGPFGMCTDLQDNCYITASFVTQYCIFDGDTVFIHPSGRTTAVMKINAAGSLQWIIEPSYTGSGSIYFLDITADQNGVYFVGYGEEDFTLGTMPVVSTTNAYRPGFMISLDFNGNALHEVHSEGFNSIVQPRAVSVNSTGDLWFAGMYRNTPTFGPFTLPAPAPSADDLFIAKLQGVSIDVNDPVAYSSVSLFYGEAGTFRLLVDEAVAQQQGQFVLYDLSGRIVKIVDISSTQTMIDCSDVASGVYAWSVQSTVAQVRAGKLVR